MSMDEYTTAQRLQTSAVVSHARRSADQRASRGCRPAGVPQRLWRRAARDFKQALVQGWSRRKAWRASVTRHTDSLTLPAVTKAEM